MSDARWSYIVELDDELLQGGAMLSTWSTSLIQNTDLCFVAGAEVATLITGMAAIEAHLRFEGGESLALFHLIERADFLDERLKRELHDLRQGRNRWVHVVAPNDEASHPTDDDQQEMARRVIRAMRQVVYSLPWI